MVGISVWQRRDSLLLALVLVIGLIARLELAFRAPLFVVNDSLSYILPAWELLHGEGFHPLYKRPPLYPLFVAGILALLGEDPQAIALAQHALGLGVVALCFVLGFTLGGTIAATIAGLLTAVSSPLLITEHYLMSESLYGALLIATLLAFFKAERDGSPRWAALVGMLLGLAALTRPIAQLLLPIFTLWLLWRYWRKWSIIGRLLLVIGAAYTTIVTPWMVRNLLVQGSFTVAGGAGEGIAVRTIRYDQKFDFRAPTGGETDLLRAARRIYRDEARDGSAFELAARLRNELNVTPAVADTLMRQIAVESIRQQPVYFITGTVDMFWKVLTGRPARLRQDWVPWRGMVWDPRIEHLIPRATPIQEAEQAQAERVTSVYDPARWWPAVLGLAALGALLGGPRAPRRLSVLLAGTVLVQIAFAAALVGIEWRYRYPLDPLLHALIGVGIAAMVACVRQPRGHRSRLGQPVATGPD